MKSLKNENVFKHQPQNYYYYFLFHFNRTVFNEKHSQKKYNFMKRKDIEIFYNKREKKIKHKTMLDNNHERNEREIGYVYVIVCFMECIVK